MLVLKIGREPEWVDILGGVLRLKVAPLTSAVMMAVRSDLSTQGRADSTVDDWHVHLVKAIAARVILEWEGVGDGDGEPIAVTPEGISALMDLHRVFAEFDAKVVAPYLMVQAEKKGSSPLPSGTSEGATDTAAPATASAPSAPGK